MILSNKEKFIIEVVEEKLVIRNVRKLRLVEILRQRGYTRFSDFPEIKSTKLHIMKKEGEKDEKEEE